jgi:hypothetical protein
MKDAPDLTNTNRMGSVAFESSEEFVPLQAADLLSQQLRRHVLTQGREATTAATVERLCGNGRVQVNVLDKRLMEEAYWPLGLASLLPG